MIINTGTILGLRCSKCGKLSFHVVSLFAFSGSGTIRLNCDCGAIAAIISTTNKKKFSLQVDCSMCETNHVYYYTLKEIWSPEILSLICMETGLEIGFIGPKAKVKEAWYNQEKAIIDLVEDAGFSDFFDNPDVMYQVLEYLNTISEKGQLECRCGNTNIDLEILPDRLELGCSDCGARGVIFAETKADLLALKQLNKIQLSDQGFILKKMDKPKKPRKQSKK
jgi:hypothetical protein